MYTQACQGRYEAIERTKNTFGNKSGVFEAQKNKGNLIICKVARSSKCNVSKGSEISDKSRKSRRR